MHGRFTQRKRRKIKILLQFSFGAIYLKLNTCFRAVVLFLVVKKETNIYDQRLLEYSLAERHPEVKVIRRTLPDMTERASLGPNKELFMWVWMVAETTSHLLPLCLNVFLSLQWRVWSFSGLPASVLSPISLQTRRGLFLFKLHKIHNSASTCTLHFFNAVITVVCYRIGGHDFSSSDLLQLSVRAFTTTLQAPRKFSR